MLGTDLKTIGAHIHPAYACPRLLADTSHASLPYPLRPSRQTPWMQGLLLHSLTSDRHVGSW